MAAEMRAFMFSIVGRLGAALLLLFVLLTAAPAQEQEARLRVVTGIVPPFAMKEGDQLTGFSIDLREEIAARLKLQTTYQVARDSDSSFESIRSANADLGAAIVFYSTERDKEFDFSYPVVEAGQ